MSSRQDFEQIIQDVHDQPGHALQVTGTVSATNPSVGITGTTAPTSATEIAGKDSGTGNLVPVSVDATGKVNVNASITGVATEATLAAFSAKTASGIVSEDFDYQSISYVGATTDVSSVVYKLGGSGGTTVATVSYGYDGSNRVTSITKT